MSLKNDKSIFRLTSFRLTIWYALVFAIAAVTVYFIAYWTIRSDLNRRVDLELMEEINELIEAYNDDIDEVTEEIKEEEDEEDTDKIMFRLITLNLQSIVSTDTSKWVGLDTFTSSILTRLSDDVLISEAKFPGRKYRDRIASKKMAKGHIIQIGFSYEEEEKLLLNFSNIFGIVISIMTMTGCIMGWLMARKAMAGVQRVTDSAKSIAEGDLKHRVAIGEEGAEIENLAITFNEMITRIQCLIDEMSEVTNNIAHDLRSPITRIRLLAEQNLANETDKESAHTTSVLIIEECDRLVQMIKTMLEMAEMDAGVTKFDFEKIDIVKLIEDAVDLFQPVAEQKNIVIKINARHNSIYINGNQSMLQRVISNLLDNALKYTSNDGTVAIEVSDSDDQIDISIIDSGVIIGAEDLPHIFKPFYRADKSRTTSGNGLGLSLARSIIAVHSGRIFAKSLPDHGNKFTIFLPSIS